MRYIRSTQIDLFARIAMALKAEHINPNFIYGTVDVFHGESCSYNFPAIAFDVPITIYNLKGFHVFRLWLEAFAQMHMLNLTIEQAQEIANEMVHSFHVWNGTDCPSYRERIACILPSQSAIQHPLGVRPMKTNIELAIINQRNAAFAYWNAVDSRDTAMRRESALRLAGFVRYTKALERDRDWWIQDAITWQNLAARASKRARVLMGIESDELNEYERRQRS